MKAGKRVFEVVMLFHLPTGKYVLPGDFCTPVEVLPSELRSDITTALDRLEVCHELRQYASLSYFTKISDHKKQRKVKLSLATILTSFTDVFQV